MIPGRGRVTATLALAVLLGGCFEEPVSEELELSFPDAATVEVSVQVTLRVPQGDTGQSALIARLDTLERDLLAGASPWSRRFASLEPGREGQAWQREGGRLQWFRQWAAADPVRLGDFFADTPVQAFYQQRDARSELVLYPGPGSRATAAEARKVAAALDPWIDAVAAYEAAGWRLWNHLERHPRRRRACLGHLFELDLAEGEGDRLPPLTPAEEKLLEDLGESTDAVDSVLQLPTDEPETLDELARRVYDPYPAKVRVKVAGRVLAAEGFRAGVDDGWELPARSPWLAFEGLAGLWLSPDPLLARIEHARRQDQQPFDLEGFLSQPFHRAGEQPTAAAVRQALLDALARPGTSRLEWEPIQPR